MAGHADGEVLERRIENVLDFYYPACVDERGGYIAQLDPETGSVYDRDARHLVATARFVSNFSIGVRAGGPDWCTSAAAHGLRFLDTHHRDGERGGYAWLLDVTDPVDGTRSPYGHAFVLLAHARALEVGLDDHVSFDLRDRLVDVASLIERRFREPAHDLLGCRLDADWNPIGAYRGQNANMHACEAFLAAYETTDEQSYLERALTIARRVTVDLADPDGRIWEHYTEAWEPDHDYNRSDPRHQFRPWGFQPGHHAEWAKLLAALARHREAAWLSDRAVELFEYALTGWADDGGFYYTLDFADEPVVADRYGWPVAEAIGAAAALHEATGEARYLEWYDRFWTYAVDRLVAPGGSWYEKLTPDHEPVVTTDGPEVEPGYHPTGACFESLRMVGHGD
ncbi:AGE family epimerase/isomerase [Halorarum salinum]|uniref:AGE family epimerase/isomerase n=1 Tax=Halorarum salinum TaxID=2743089 RepID=A0A7D5LB52_9EURY|nr:AGE family epimerase/isomerase [Halobaculum salinum]QLG61875.1 AGE family epimerase/isomerase [Halobaculum salinum]